MRFICRCEWRSKRIFDGATEAKLIGLLGTTQRAVTMDARAQ
jgi:hypothetical protein